MGIYGVELSEMNETFLFYNESDFFNNITNNYCESILNESFGDAIKGFFNKIKEIFIKIRNAIAGLIKKFINFIKEKWDKIFKKKKEIENKKEEKKEEVKDNSNNKEEEKKQPKEENGVDFTFTDYSKVLRETSMNSKSADDITKILLDKIKIDKNKVYLDDYFYNNDHAYDDFFNRIRSDLFDKLLCDKSELSEYGKLPDNYIEANSEEVTIKITNSNFFEIDKKYFYVDKVELSFIEKYANNFLRNDLDYMIRQFDTLSKSNSVKIKIDDKNQKVKLKNKSDKQIFTQIITHLVKFVESTKYNISTLIQTSVKYTQFYDKFLKYFIFEFDF